MADDGASTDGVDLDPANLLRVLLGAVILGSYAAWIAADLVGRWLMFPVVAIVSGFFLFQRSTGHEQVVFVGYALAALVAVTPLMMVLPDSISGNVYGPGPLAMTVLLMNFVLFLLFAAIGGVIAYVTYRYDGGTGLLTRLGVRNRRSETVQ